MNVFVSVASTKIPLASVVAQLLVVSPAHSTQQITISPVSLATLPYLELSAPITRLASALMDTTRRLQHASPALLAVFPALLMESTPFATLVTHLCSEQ